ncbi:hypothetical protein CPT_Moabite_049 [Serratia phage Moabite]|uniref:Uncharacterized protein n=1 Tax=Serratia phage Moabite TaxID=2587814 RepID=A0A4Y5TR78_9CAUD|nr:hypothetical protein HWC48_gp049 [Serratia phage Moabite]QDB71081.1 hypothetical protein CPT_Moabite_049 [Serratia phage Moabite]UCR74590.1 hypothetical protein [Serratia phage BUCT660]UGO54266.1 hypothetical protein HAYMO_284 [Serratia phage vB_SmaM_Haymo]UQT03771.1 hypothetical protein KODAMA_03040 [Serratia phage vB_SmaM-Kodama]
MEIYFDPEIDEKQKLVLMGHPGEEPLVWDMRYYKKVNAEMFRDINDFWRWRPEEEQAAIFQAFRNIRDVLGVVFDPNVLFSIINKEVIKIAKYHPIDLVDHWVRTRSQIRFPDNLKDEMDERDRPEQTYLRDDYRQLTSLSVILKFMLPIWSEYTMLKLGLRENQQEVVSMALLQRSGIEESAPFQRFRVFVDYIASDNDPGMRNILEGIGTLDMPEWIFSLMMVERLAAAVVSHNDDANKEQTVNLISTLWAQTRAKLSPDQNRKKGDVRPKTFTSANGSEEDNSSTAESYKPKERISDGTRIEFDYSAADAALMGRRLMNDIDLDLLKRLVRRNSLRKYFNPTEEQVKLTALTLAKINPTRAMPHTDRTGAINMLSVAQTYLHQKGFSTLADLLGASRGEPCNTISGSEQIKDHHKTILATIYPYRRQVKAGTGSKTVLKDPGTIAIETLTSKFAGYYWYRDTDDVIAESSKMVIREGGMVIPSDIRLILADFIIALNGPTGL